MKKKKRRLLGVGHPYFFTPDNDRDEGWPLAVMLLKKDRGKPKPISTCGIGAWKKVRIYLEWTD